MATATTQQPTPQQARTKPRREDLRPGENLCMHCTAKCCQYFALPLEEPTELEDYEHMRWFLLHDRASIFTDDEDWYLMVHTTCKKLRPDNMCGIYETRPQICRKYSTTECEYEDDWCYERYFETAEQVAEYTEAVLGPQGKKLMRSPKPNPLKVV